MAKKKKSLTHWIFLLGALVAALVGIAVAASWVWASNKWIPVILVLLGLIVGLANISVKETVPFLVAVIALFVFGSSILGSLDTLIPKLGTLLGSAVQAFSFFVGAAALVVAFKEAWNLASKEK